MIYIYTNRDALLGEVMEVYGNQERFQFCLVLLKGEGASAVPRVGLMCPHFELSVWLNPCQWMFGRAPISLTLATQQPPG